MDRSLFRECEEYRGVQVLDSDNATDAIVEGGNVHATAAPPLHDYARHHLLACFQVCQALERARFVRLRIVGRAE